MGISFKKKAMRQQVRSPTKAGARAEDMGRRVLINKGFWRKSEKERFLRKRDYDEYHLDTREGFRIVLQGMGICAAFDYLFFQNVFLMVLAVPFCVYYFKSEKKRLRDERRRLINEQFRDALVSLNVAVQAGYSIENALRECHSDLKKMYPPGADILEELSFMENQLFVSVPVEELFLDLGRRTGAEDIESFAAVFVTAKRSGGDMSEIIQKVTRMISDKIDVKKEIYATLAGKRYEQTIMSLMPAGIILYMRLTSPGYLDVMYGNAIGLAVMTACLAIYAFSFWLGRRIIQIEV